MSRSIYYFWEAEKLESQCTFLTKHELKVLNLLHD